MINRVHPGKVKEAKEKSLRSYKAKRKKEFKKITQSHLSKSLDNKGSVSCYTNGKKTISHLEKIIKYRGRSQLYTVSIKKKIGYKH